MMSPARRHRPGRSSRRRRLRPRRCRFVRHRRPHPRTAAHRRAPGPVGRPGLRAGGRRRVAADPAARGDPPGDAADVPLLIGTNRDEWNLFRILSPGGLDHANVIDRLDRSLRRRPARPRRLRRRPTRRRHRRALERGAHRRRLPAPGRSACSRPGPPACAAATYQYLFTWASPAFGGVAGSCHALEIPFVFGVLGNQGAELILGGDGRPRPVGALGRHAGRVDRLRPHRRPQPRRSPDLAGMVARRPSGAAARRRPSWSSSTRRGDERVAVGGCAVSPERRRLPPCCRAALGWARLHDLPRHRPSRGLRPARAQLSLRPAPHGRARLRPCRWPRPPASSTWWPTSTCAAFGGSALVDGDIEVPKHDDVDRAHGGGRRRRDPDHLRAGPQHDLPAASPSPSPRCVARPTSSSASTRSTTPAIPTAVPSSSPPSRRWPTWPPGPASRGIDLTIHTPLIDLTKAEIIRRGIALGRRLRRRPPPATTPAPTGGACGRCDACLLRAQRLRRRRRARPDPLHRGLIGGPPCPPTW